MLLLLINCIVWCLFSNLLFKCRASSALVPFKNHPSFDHVWELSLVSLVVALCRIAWVLHTCTQATQWNAALEEVCVILVGRNREWTEYGSVKSAVSSQTENHNSGFIFFFFNVAQFRWLIQKYCHTVLGQQLCGGAGSRLGTRLHPELVEKSRCCPPCPNASPRFNARYSPWRSSSHLSRLGTGEVPKRIACI